MFANPVSTWVVGLTLCSEVFARCFWSDGEDLNREPGLSARGGSGSVSAVDPVLHQVLLCRG